MGLNSRNAMYLTHEDHCFPTEQHNNSFFDWEYLNEIIAVQIIFHFI